MRTRSARSGRRIRVLQLGPSGEQPGGMAQVVNTLLTWSDEEFEVLPLVSTRYRHDPLALLLFARTAAHLLLHARARSRPRPVVVAHLSERGSFIREGGLLLMARLLGYGTIAHLHGASFDAFAAAWPRLVRLVLGRAHAVAVLTDGMGKTARRLLGQNAPVTIVRNPVEIPPHRQDKEPVVMFAGEVGQRKGADVLATAWRDLPRSVSDGWRLVVAGPIASESIAATLRSQSRVSVVGSLPHDEVLNQFATAAVVTLPSRAEALPMTILEAMAAGCAVVATSVGQVEDVIRDSETGLIVPPGSSDALRDALAELMKDAAIRTRLAQNGAQLMVHNYSSPVVRAQLNRLWTTVAGG